MHSSSCCVSDTWDAPVCALLPMHQLDARAWDPLLQLPALDHYNRIVHNMVSSSRS